MWPSSETRDSAVGVSALTRAAAGPARPLLGELKDMGCGVGEQHVRTAWERMGSLGVSGGKTTRKEWGQSRGGA